MIATWLYDRVTDVEGDPDHVVLYNGSYLAVRTIYVL